MTNDMKAFVVKLLINTGTKKEQSEKEAGVVLFKNMVQRDPQSASVCLDALGNSPSIFLFYRDKSIGSAEAFFTGRPMTKLGVGKLLTSLSLACTFPTHGHFPFSNGGLYFLLPGSWQPNTFKISHNWQKGPMFKVPLGGSSMLLSLHRNTKILLLLFSTPR